MRIWQVTESDTQIRFYWFATKKEAEQHRRAYEPPPNLSGTCEVQPIEVKMDHICEGLVDAMNWVISLTCFNEG